VSPDHGFHPLPVKRIVQETHDTKSFVFDVPPDLRDAFVYEAGQFCTFRIPFGDEELLRCYSMSSSPATDTELTLTVKRVAGGRVSNWMLDRVGEGDVLALTRPAGVFTLRSRTTPIVAFAGGSGITPVFSLVKSTLATTARRVRLLYANRDAASVIFRAELDDLERAHPDRLQVDHHLDTEHGFVHSNGVTDFVGDELDADFYICGPGPFMDVVEAALEERKVGRGHIFIERFVSPADPDRVPVEPEPAAKPAASVAASYVCMLEGTRHEVPVAPGETLLAAAKRAGLEPSFSCEEGYCGCCMAQLRRGKVKMRTHDALTAKDLAKGWVLACQSRLEGEETVELDFDARY